MHGQLELTPPTKLVSVPGRDWPFYRACFGGLTILEPTGVGHGRG